IWTAAYLSQLPSLPESRSIPVFSYESDISLYQPANGAKVRKQYDAWYRRHLPEAIVSVTRTAAELSAILKYDFPKECPIVTATLQESEKTSAGVIEVSREIGGAAA